MININKIMFYILHNNFCIENEEFYIKWYFKNNKLTQEQKDEFMQKKILEDLKSNNI